MHFRGSHEGAKHRRRAAPSKMLRFVGQRACVAVAGLILLPVSIVAQICMGRSLPGELEVSGFLVLEQA